MRIDAHQHFWNPELTDYGWLDESCGPLFRAYEPSELAPLLQNARIDQTILVQAAASEAESRLLLTVAERTSFVAGVICWVDLAATDAAARIAALAKNRLAVGVRPMLQDIGAPDWILRDELRPALDALSINRLVFDALVRAPQLVHVATLAERQPGLSIVLDHGGKPAIGSGLAAWCADTARIAAHPNTSCKLSGLLTEAPADADTAMLQPVVDHLIAVFGPDRIMWGSDWPVLTVASNYACWAAMAAELLSRLTIAERDAILGGNARRIYRLDR